MPRQCIQSPTDPSSIQASKHVQPHDVGVRLDVFVARRLFPCSRSQALQSIRQGLIQVNGDVRKASYRLSAGERVHGTIIQAGPLEIAPADISISILHQDDDIIVINKPPGLVVHPAPGHVGDTLVNGLLFHFPEIEKVGEASRPGIVHRLDKDTSGVMVAARSQTALAALARQFKARQVEKVYWALVYQAPPLESGVVKLGLGRHPSNRKKMSVHGKRIRTAETHWRVRERFPGAALLQLDLKTGRTHQARVHCAAMHHPVIGDAVYAKSKYRERLLKDRRLCNGLKQLLRTTNRQMLHAWRLSFTHPSTMRPVVFEAPLPDDMRMLLEALRETEFS